MTDTQAQSASAAQPTVTIHQVLDAAERLTSSIATEFHKDAAVSAQFMAGEWQKFKAVILAARNAHGPSPAPQPATDPTSAPVTDQAARIKELEAQLAAVKTGVTSGQSTSQDSPVASTSSDTNEQKGLA